MRRPLSTLLLCLSLLFIGCGDDGGGGVDAGHLDAHVQSDAEAPDAGELDAGEADAGAGDAGTDAGTDAGEPDAGTDAGAPDAGLDEIGAIAGSCGVLDDEELLGESAFYFGNNLDFMMGFDEEADLDRLSDDAREILADGTAGGSSVLSEIFAFEILRRCEGATLIKSETEIVYDPPTSKKTDILVDIDGYPIGVSVTRAVSYPRDAAYPVATARTLLERKLGDILESSANVVEEDAWRKQILVIIAYSETHAMAMMQAWTMIDDAVRADTILWVTVSDGDDEFLY